MDLLDRLLNIGPIDGYLDIRCELRPPWKLDNPGSAQREIPYHVLLSGEVLVEGPDLPATILQAGDILMLPSGVPHRILDRPVHASTPIDRQAAILLCGRIVLTQTAWRLYRSLLPASLVVRTADGDTGNGASRLSRLLELMREETDQQLPGSIVVLQHLSAALFGLTLRVAAHGTQPPAGMLALAGHPRLRELALRIIETPAGNWTIEDMASACNMSRSSLIRSFVAVAGIAPAEFVTSVRIAEASRLLRETENSVAAIGEVVGYASDAAFQRAFKRETTMTPAAWRMLPADEAKPAQALRQIAINMESAGLSSA